VEQARRSAEVTHAHPEGIAGTIAVAVAAALAYQLQKSGSKLGRQDFLEGVLPFVPEGEVHRKIKIAQELPVGTSVQEAANLLGNGRPVLAQLTVPFTLWAAGEYLGDFEAAIRKTASVQGDVDTNCAIVGGIVVMYTGKEGIPQEWLKRREPIPSWS